MLSLVKFWKKHQFKVIVLACVCIIWGLYMYQPKDQQGTWSMEYTYNPSTKEYRFKRESKGEKECRRVMQRLFERPFPCQRPSFLNNPATGKNLEIDCCNLDLQLGVEYNGIQHYQFVSAMHKTQEAFRQQQYRDELKKELCSASGFTLITVPYTVQHSAIENYLIEELRRHGFLG